MEIVPLELQIVDFKDFATRCEDIYFYFWDSFAPLNDIIIYRKYLLERVEFSKYEERQVKIAGIVWEYLMGDIDEDVIYSILYKKKH